MSMLHVSTGEKTYNEEIKKLYLNQCLFKKYQTKTFKSDCFILLIYETSQKSWGTKKHKLDRIQNNRWT